jgi:NAD(P)-dependent dehydrogenase (short-subunit alcohol dehydrogenase family)
MRLKDKAALVTGAGSGIGRGIALMFAAEGARVTAADVDRSGGEATVREIAEAGGQAHFEYADISQRASVQHLVEAAVARWGGLDVLVNNAGIVRVGSVTETSLEDWDAVMNTNLRGTFLCSRAALPHLVASGHGAIVNIGSIGGLHGSAGLAAYSTAKAGVINLTRQMAADYGEQNVRANCICPGTIVTNMHRAFYTAEEQEETLAEWAKNRPLHFSGEPKDIAYAAVYLASDEARFVTGSVLVVDGGARA